MSGIDPTADIHARIASAEAALRAIGQSIHPMLRDLDVAVLVPCYNEAATITDVVSAFRSALPAAAIYVYDNNSKDSTADIARNAGAIVRSESHQGKGYVVRRMYVPEQSKAEMLSGTPTEVAKFIANLIREKKG